MATTKDPSTTPITPRQRAEQHEGNEPRFNQANQREGALLPEGETRFPEKPPVLDPADEPISMGDSPPIDLVDLQTSQDGQET